MVECRGTRREVGEAGSRDYVTTDVGGVGAVRIYCLKRQLNLDMLVDGISNKSCRKVVYQLSETIR